MLKALTLRRKALKFRKELRAEKSRKLGLNTFGVVFENGKTEKQVAGPCYASLLRMREDGYKTYIYDDQRNYTTRTSNNAKNGGVEYFIDIPRSDVWMQDKKEIMMMKKYVGWITRKSPYSPAFITKGFTVIRDKGVLFRTSQTSQLTVAAAICIRYLHEHNYVPSVWYKFVRGGVEEHIAFWLAHNVNRSGDTYTYMNSRCNGHAAFGPAKNMEALKNFINRTSKIKTTFKKTGEYRGMDTQFGMSQSPLNPERYMSGKTVTVDSRWGGRPEQRTSIDFNKINENLKRLHKQLGVECKK
tara:strand:- start:6272 stop:7171 length:900 start_codon:yes stop_codon:yes gene_type:complete